MDERTDSRSFDEQELIDLIERLKYEGEALTKILNDVLGADSVLETIEGNNPKGKDRKNNNG